ncbi:MAG: hypothetical protein WC876_08620 [Candidatus Thermoplasmatota archaeon]|jgi:uncharacterized membrane protein
MMTPDMVRERRKAGIAMVAGLASLWLSMFPWAGIALVLRVAGVVGLLLAAKWGADKEHLTRAKIGSAIVLLAAILQVQNFFFAASLLSGADRGDWTRFFAADHAVPALALLGLAVFPRLAGRRSESALLWTAAGLAAVFMVVGLANGVLMKTTGAPTEAWYRGLIISLRTISFLPAVIAGILLLVPAREVMTNDQMWDYAAQKRAEASQHLREAADVLASAEVDETAQTPRLPAPSTAVSAVPAPAGMTNAEMLTLLDGRLARNELSEASWLLLRKKYQNQE